MSLKIYRPGIAQKNFAKECDRIAELVAHTWHHYFDLPDEWTCFLRFGRLQNEVMAETVVEAHYRRFSLKFDCVRIFNEMKHDEAKLVGTIQHELLHVVVAPLANAAQIATDNSDMQAYLVTMEETVVETLQRSIAYGYSEGDFGKSKK